MAELVIKIDDETYKQAINRTEFDTLSLGIKLIEAVQSGTPLEEELEKLKAEFEDKILLNQTVAIQIIDKHIEELKGEE